MIKPSYRPEIDGLRAIAIGSVILYHAQLNILDYKIFEGGFIGVDIFFVISGYLITSIIIKELITSDSFSFKYFYERRIRRILPVLLFVILVFLPFGWLYLLPNSIIDFAKSILYTLGLSSNFYFHYSGQEYGAQNGELIPFLHTWSLSIEEQFYIIFPLTIVILFRYFKKYLIHILILCFVISFFLANFGSKNYPSLNFYILPTRVWELLAGSILAYFEIIKGYRKKIYKINIVFPFLGLILISYSLLFYNDKIPHPSIYTLIPVMGVCLVIFFSNKNELVTKLLSTKLFVGIGLISYSLYLWHYPIFAFFRVAGFSRDANLTRYFLLIITLLTLSLFSYYFIEKPFRDKKKKFKIVITFILSAAIVIVVFTTMTILNNGYKNRLPEILKQNLLNEDWNEIKSRENKYCNNPINIKDCGLKDFDKKIFIIGDSQMNLISKQLIKNLLNDDFKFITYTVPGCLFFPGFNRVNRITEKIDKECNNEYFQQLKKILINEKNSIIVFGGRLPLYLSNYLFNNMEGGVEGNVWNKKYVNVDIYKDIAVSFKKEILKIEKNNFIILIYPIPEVGFSPEHKILSEWIKNKFIKKKNIEFITTSYDVFKNRTKSSFELLDSIRGQNVYRIYPHKLFCAIKVSKPERCLTHDDKNIFYSDSNHTSLYGSKLISDLIVKEIDKIKTKYDYLNNK